MITAFSPEEQIRYQRHFILEKFGIEGQKKLKNAKVLCVGAGGLGCSALQYLTASGVGNITIIDSDSVAESNLHRQILYSSDDIGKNKALVAKQKLQKQNPFVQIIAIDENLSKNNVLNLFSSHDVIIDGTDNFATRYLCNDAAVITNKPWVYGAIYTFQGQVSVFNFNGSATYRCLFPEPPSPENSPNCADVGVIGVLPGIIGTLQAMECIKLITQIGKPLVNTLLVVDILTMEFFKLKFKKDQEQTKITSLLDNYEEFCSSASCNSNGLKSKIISCEKLYEWLKENKEVQLLDVREYWEREIAHLGGFHIPLKNLNEQSIKALRKDRPLVVYCHHGIRSLTASRWFYEYGFKEVYSLEGGIHAWASKIDHKIKKY
jgi:adenylyltransferase/sulfurtransferase